MSDDVTAIAARHAAAERIMTGFAPPWGVDYAQAWCEAHNDRATLLARLHEMTGLWWGACAARTEKAVERTHWERVAAQEMRNTEYYRSLVVEIGEMLGEAAYISDDGTRQQDVLCAKVPELVRAQLHKVPILPPRTPFIPSQDLDP